MNKILAISTLAIAACLSFNSVAKAEDSSATSTHTGTVAPTCSVTAVNGTFTATNVTINGVEFPKSLASTGGKFTTLCNTASSAISIGNDVTLTTYPDRIYTPTITYHLTAPSTVYPSLDTTSHIPLATKTTATAVHGYSTNPSDIGITMKVVAPSNKILQAGRYEIFMKATLTP
jgi:hypothetical protein